MRIVFIGNYTPDKQESMQRFSELLYSGFKRSGADATIWRPTVIVGHLFKDTAKGVAKWFGYIDKWILFPLILKWRLLRDKKLRGPETHFHICDHSNAPYLKFLPPNNTAITCHDVLAIRGALGYKDAYCSATRTGKILQMWILENLSSAKTLVATSRLTLKQLEALAGEKSPKGKDWRIIHLGFNADFRPMPKTERDVILRSIGLDPDVPFILHVGSSQERKNRKMLIDMTVALGGRWKGKIVYAGQAIDGELKSHAISSGVSDRLVSVVNPDHRTLVALYSACYVYVWPSFSEGFGWPLIEAQACGAPVISSNFEPMPEVSNYTAVHADPTKPEEFAQAFLKLTDEKVREEVIRKGLQNSASFSPEKMINAYLALHGLKGK